MGLNDKYSELLQEFKKNWKIVLPNLNNTVKYQIDKF